MPNLVKLNLLEKLSQRYGSIQKLPKSLSLFDVGNNAFRLYIRYSKLHSKNQAFYGLRYEDLKQLAGINSIICFIWDNQKEPLFIPFSDFEDVFNEIIPASDGQFKTTIFLKDDVTELYIANAGRFNVESFFGWGVIDNLIDFRTLIKIPNFSHYQVQTIIGSIGKIKGYDIWIPFNDRNKLDWNYSEKFICKETFPLRYDKIVDTLKEVDVVWIKKGSSDIKAMFEVEHSTPIYSGLLRFNDLHLVEPKLHPQYNIVSNSVRRSLFLRQINRPTFRVSGLKENCNFLEYKDVFIWHKRLWKG